LRHAYQQETAQSPQHAERGTFMMQGCFLRRGDETHPPVFPPCDCGMAALLGRHHHAHFLMEKSENEKLDSVQYLSYPMH
jgi:hypothetical protein